MVGNVEITKKIVLELTEAELNTIVAAVGKAEVTALTGFGVSKGVKLLETYGMTSELSKFYSALKSLAGIK